jgi:3-phenylpropionate/trans-cinnamate dioxygenase ferredoxin reductase subunit
VTSDGRLLPADVVVVGIGVVPNVELAAQAGLHTGNGILVDDALSTADRAVSALGDCAFYSSRFCGPVRMESVQNAVDQARCIAARLTGSGDGYAAVPWFWSDQRDLKLQIVGMTSGCDRMEMKGDPDARSFSVFCFKGEALAGIESVNRPADHMFGRRLFASGLQITAAEVADPEFDPREFLKRAAVSGR